MDEGTSEARSVTRRRLVKGAAGAAAVSAAAVAAVRVPGTLGQKTAPVADTAADTSASSPSTGSLPKQDWVIYVRDADAGTLDLFVDTKHITVRDSDLVARLIAAAK